MKQRKLKIQEQLNLVNEILNERINSLRDELTAEIQALEFVKTREELKDRLDKIEYILANKIAEESNDI